MNTPNIRFKGYTDAWEQRKFGEFAQRQSETRMSDNEVPCVEYEDVIAEQGVLNKNIRAKENNKTGIVFSEDDVLYGKLRPYLHNWLNPDFKGVAVGDWWVLKPQDMDKNFLYRLLQTPQFDDAANQSTGTKMPRADWKLISNLEFRVPGSIEEQAKLGKHFNNLDNLITLHQRKCDDLQEVKKYMLQKLFPQNGAKIPEIRFAGFTGEWEQRKLGDVIEDYVEKTTIEDQFPVLTSSQQKGIVLQDEYFSGERVSQNGNIGYFVIPRGYFAYRSRSDNDVFVFNRNDAIDMGIISYFYPVFKPMGVDSDFLLRRLNYGLEEQIKINSEGTGQHVLSLKKFKNIVGVFPSYEEQKLIGRYFKELDNLITLQQRKCDDLKEVKRYMLQNMFPQGK